MREKLVKSGHEGKRVNSLAAQRHCCADKSFLPQPVRQWCGQLKHLQHRFVSNVEKNGQVDVLERV